MNLESGILYYISIINLLAYSLMWIDKVKSIYQWWRVSEKTLWTIALLGGALGIWLGMQAPLHHKAGKRNFRVWIPILGLIYIFLLVKYLL